METKSIFKNGDYITKNTKAAYPSLQTMQIRYFIGSYGAECTTSIAGGCTVENLRNYRIASNDEIVEYLKTLANAYRR